MVLNSGHIGAAPISFVVLLVLSLGGHNMLTEKGLDHGAGYYVKRGRYRRLHERFA